MDDDVVGALVAEVLADTTRGGVVADGGAVGPVLDGQTDIHAVLGSTRVVIGEWIGSGRMVGHGVAVGARSFDTRVVVGDRSSRARMVFRADRRGVVGHEHHVGPTTVVLAEGLVIPTGRSIFVVPGKAGNRHEARLGVEPRQDCVETIEPAAALIDRDGEHRDRRARIASIAMGEDRNDLVAFQGDARFTVVGDEQPHGAVFLGAVDVHRRRETIVLGEQDHLPTEEVGVGRCQLEEVRRAVSECGETVRVGGRQRADPDRGDVAEIGQKPWASASSIISSVQYCSIAVRLSVGRSGVHPRRRQNAWR
ncbi:hypothetical protein [Nocardia sp. NPDC023988]|uniref:hypothetical protein n=1 Tax=unclassified Nocardia TaxID=2637762 RepID=UPI0033FB7A16